MSAEPETYFLPNDRSLWPHPRQVESVCDAAAFQLALMMVQVGQNRRVSGSDIADGYHYALSRFIVFVTDDQRFLEAERIIPHRLATFMGSHEFFQTYVLS